jgi:hypothetical protein
MSRLEDPLMIFQISIVLTLIIQLETIHKEGSNQIINC